jgi:hypothetical protein
MAPDPITRLEEIKERHRRWNGEQSDPSVSFTDWAAMVESSANDVPPLLGALEAVLAIHSLTAYSSRLERCAKHRTWAGTGLDRYEIGMCPDCVTVERYGLCDRCKDEHGNPAPAEECEIRLAITAALAGRSATGAAGRALEDKDHG